MRFLILNLEFLGCRGYKITLDIYKNSCIIEPWLFLLCWFEHFSIQVVSA